MQLPIVALKTFPSPYPESVIAMTEVLEQHLRNVVLSSWDAITHQGWLHPSTLIRHQVEYSCDAAGGVGEVLDFLGVEGAVEDFVLAVGEPFLEDLVAA